MMSGIARGGQIVQLTRGATCTTGGSDSSVIVPGIEKGLEVRCGGLDQRPRGTPQDLASSIDHDRMDGAIVNNVETLEEWRLVQIERDRPFPNPLIRDPGSHPTVDKRLRKAASTLDDWQLIGREPRIPLFEVSRQWHPRVDQRLVTLPEGQDHQIKAAFEVARKDHTAALKI